MDENANHHGDRDSGKSSADTVSGIYGRIDEEDESQLSSMPSVPDEGLRGGASGQIDMLDSLSDLEQAYASEKGKGRATGLCWQFLRFRDSLKAK